MLFSETDPATTVPNVMGSGPLVGGPSGSTPALAPSWATGVAMVAVMVETVLAALVWHATQLNPVDAWVMRWQERAWVHADGLAQIISSTLPIGAAVVAMVGGAALARVAERRDAVVLALTAVPATLAAELLLKRLVHRRWNGDPALVFPSGHTAVATATAVIALLVLRVVPVAPTVRISAAFLVGGFVLVVAVARLVETVHSLTDVVAGVAVGLAVTLGDAVAITVWWRRADRRPGSPRPSSAWAVDDDDAPASAADRNRSKPAGERQA
jgi:membrane-associated phospholipid phosphatase